MMSFKIGLRLIASQSKGNQHYFNFKIDLELL